MKIFLSILVVAFVAMTVTGIGYLTPWKNDCMYEYVRQSMETGNWKGVAFQFESGNRHIEHISNEWQPLAPYFVGTANGCLINSGGAVSSVFNSYYCVVMTWVVSTGLKSGFLK